MNEEIIRNTIAKMREAGLSDSAIGSTLSDLGLSAGQVQGFLVGNDSRPSPSSPPSSSSRSSLSFRSPSAYGNPAPAPPSNVYFARSADTPSHSLSRDINHEVLASRTSDKVVQRLDEREALSSKEADLKDSISHLALEQHGQQLQGTHQAVLDLHEKFDATSLDTISNRVTALNGKIDALSRDTMETKAVVMALQSLMQKILEMNQQLLFESKTKK